MAKRRYSLVVIGAWSLESHFWCKACVHFKVPYIIICYGTELIIDLKGPPASWKKEDLRSARKIVVISRGTGSLVEKAVGGKIDYLVINPGIEPTQNDKFDPFRVMERKTTMGIPSDGTV